MDQAHVSFRGYMMMESLRRKRNLNARQRRKVRRMIRGKGFRRAGKEASTPVHNPAIASAIMDKLKRDGKIVF